MCKCFGSIIVLALVQSSLLKLKFQLHELLLFLLSLILLDRLEAHIYICFFFVSMCTAYKTMLYLVPSVPSRLMLVIVNNQRAMQLSYVSKTIMLPKHLHMIRPIIDK